MKNKLKNHAGLKVLRQCGTLPFFAFILFYFFQSFTRSSFAVGNAVDTNSFMQHNYTDFGCLYRVPCSHDRLGIQCVSLNRPV